jgi:hypothetical protein
MTEPSAEEREKLAARAQWIASALGKSNGHAVVAVSPEPEDPALEAWCEEYAKTAEGARVSALLNLELTHLVDTMIAQVVKPLRRETAELKAELATCLKAGDIWNAATAYPANAVVTARGKLWQAKQSNCNERPPSAAWRLMHHQDRG